MKYSDNDLEKIRKVITSEQNVSVALHMMRAYIHIHNLTYLESQLDKIEDDYKRMKDFMKRSLKDPQLGEVYNGLLRSLYRLNSNIQLSQMIKLNSSYKNAYSIAKRFHVDFEEINQELESFVQEQTLLSITPENLREGRKKVLYETHQLYLETLFNGTLVSRQWNESLADFAEQTLLSPTIDSTDAQMLINAICLSTIELFDLQKFLTLVHLFNKSTDQHLRQRALVGIVLSIPYEEGFIFTEIGQSLKSMTDDEEIANELLELQMQFFYCSNADADNDKIQKDIIPGLMKGNNLTISRTGIFDKDEDRIQDILNPEAAEQAMEALEENFQKMLNMQKAGSDIYFGGFSQMKRFGFFMTLSNWFIPFYPEHPELESVNAKLGDTKFMQLLADNGPFCDSDKYSFALAMSSILAQMPAEMREMLNHGEAIGPMIPTEEKEKPAYIRRMLLQDLYRFYRLYTNKQDFHNPFDLPKDANSVFFFMDLVLRGTALKNQVINLGHFLYKHRFDQQLRALLEAYPLWDDPDYCKLLAKVLYRLKDYSEADRVYDRLLAIAPNDRQAIQGKANCSFHLEEYEKAVMYYQRALESEVSNEQIQLNLAVSQINGVDIEEGMAKLFRLNYEHPENLMVQRSLAWGYLRQGKPENAETIYARLLNNQKKIPEDSLNAGYCKWFLMKIPEAVELFQNFELTRSSQKQNDQDHQSLFDIFVMDSKLLRQYHIQTAEVYLMMDLVNED